jgi:hypothetical protein
MGSARRWRSIRRPPAANAGDRLALILSLWDTYLKDHGADTDARAKTKLASVEDIQAEAVMERNKLRVEARSLNDADAVAGPNTKRTAPPVTIKSNNSVGTAIPHTQAPAKSERAAENREVGFTQATLELIKEYDQSESELLAVKLYSANEEEEEEEEDEF